MGDSMSTFNQEINTIKNYLEIFPSRNTIKFDDIEFSSNFCNGNLYNVIQYDPKTFRIFTANDNKDRQFESNHKAW